MKKSYLSVLISISFLLSNYNSSAMAEKNKQKKSSCEICTQWEVAAAEFKKFKVGNKEDQFKADMLVHKNSEIPQGKAWTQEMELPLLNLAFEASPFDQESQFISIVAELVQSNSSFKLKYDEFVKSVKADETSSMCKKEKLTLGVDEQLCLNKLPQNASDKEKTKCVRTFDYSKCLKK